MPGACQYGTDHSAGAVHDAVPTKGCSAFGNEKPAELTEWTRWLMWSFSALGRHFASATFLPPNVSSEKSVSLWMGTKVLENAPALDKVEKADVVVVGSGIAGKSVAWVLVWAGKDVVILDRGPIGKGTTSRTTAHLTAQYDDGFHQLIGRRGGDIAKAWYQSQAMSIDRVEPCQKALGIECDFRRLDGHLFYAPGTDIQILARENEATLAVGITRVPGAGRCLRGAGKDFLSALSGPGHLSPAQVSRRACRGDPQGRWSLLCRNHRRDLRRGREWRDRDNGRGTRRHCQACCDSHQFADQRPLRDPRQAGPYRTYAMAFSVPRGALPDGLYWDTLEAYHYVRLRALPASGLSRALEQFRALLGLPLSRVAVCT